MDKDMLNDGIGFIDDELIDEAERASGLSYRAKIRIIRTLIIGAAAAAMITTAVLLHMNGHRSASGNGGDNLVTAQEKTTEKSADFPNGGQSIIVTTDGADGENSIVTAYTSAGKPPESTTVSAGASDPVVTDSVPRDEEVTTAAVDSTQGEEVTTASYSPPAEPEPFPPAEFTYDENGLFKTPEDYSYAGDPDVVYVQYGNQHLRDSYGLWINCNAEQSDRNLDMVNSFELSDMVEEIGITGGGFLLRVYYNDGTFIEYELYDILGLLDITDRSGHKQRWKELSGSSHELLLQLQSDQLAVDSYISQIIDYKYGDQ